MSTERPPSSRPARTSWLDSGAAVALAMVSFTVGSAVQPHVDLPWDRDGPAMADTVSTKRLVLARQTSADLKATQDKTRSRLADERLDQTSELVEAASADATRAEKLNRSIHDREILMSALRIRLDAAVAAEAPAERRLQIAQEEATKSRKEAAFRITASQRLSRVAFALSAWMVFVLILAAIRWPFRRTWVGLLHGRRILFASLAGLALLLLAVSIGWIGAAAIALALIAGWIMVERKGDGRQG